MAAICLGLNVLKKIAFKSPLMSLRSWSMENTIKKSDFSGILGEIACSVENINIHWQSVPD